MAGPYVIQTAVQGQPASASLFGLAVKNAIVDLDSRVGALETGQQAYIKRGRRTTVPATVNLTETGILRIDNIPVRAGCIYNISTAELNLDVDSNNTIAVGRIRQFYQATSGGVCTVGNGTLVSLNRMTQPNAAQSNVTTMNGIYIATADGFISALFTIVVQSGSGGITFFAAPTEPFDMFVQFGGIDPGDSGVVLT